MSKRRRVFGCGLVLLPSLALFNGLHPDLGLYCACSGKKCFGLSCTLYVNILCFCASSPAPRALEVLRVLKTTRQTSSTSIGYVEAIKQIVEKDGYKGHGGMGFYRAAINMLRYQNAINNVTC